MLNQGRFFIEVANLVMPRVLPNAVPRDTPAARKVTPAALMRTPVVTRNIPAVARDIPANERRYLSKNGHFQTLDDLLRFILVCIMLGVKFPHWEEFMKSYMKSPKILLDAHMRKSSNSGVLSIQVFFMFGPVSSATIIDFLKSKVEELFNADPSIKFGFKFNPTDLWFVLEPKFHSLFEKIAGEMLNPSSGQTLKSEQMMEIIAKDQEPSIKALPGIREETIDEIQSHNLSTARILEAQAKDHRGNLTELFGLLPPLRSPESIRGQNAVIFCEPSVPAPLPVSQHVTPNLDDHPMETICVLPNPVRTVNDTNVLVSAVVNQSFEEEFDNFIVKSAEAIGAENQFKMSVILGEESDANALKDEVARQAFIDESAAFTSTFAAFEVVGLVNAVTRANGSLFLDPPNLNPLARSVDPVIQPSSPVTIIDYVPVSPTDYFPSASSETPSLKNVTHSDADSAHLFVAINSPIPPGQTEVDRQIHAIEVGGPLSVIKERTEDGADQSGNTSPHSPDGEGRAHFTTSALYPPPGVENGALGAQPKSPLSNLGSNLSSGQNGTFLTHDCEKSSPKSSFTPAHTKPIVRSEEWTGIGVGGAQSPGNPIGNLPGIVLSTVGVRGNTHADQPSFPPKSDVGGPPVQVLAKSGKPTSDDSGGADHLETPSSSKLWSSCIPGRKPSSASQPGNSSSSWRKIFHRQSNRVNPVPGQTNDARPQVAHSPGKNPSESATTTTTLLPSSISPLGGNIGGNPEAHSPGDPPGFVPSPAPSSSSELGSAAAAALSPQSCPSGHDIGWIERNGVRSQFLELEYLVLMMEYSKAQQPPPPQWTHPCVPNVPNLLARRQARVA